MRELTCIFFTVFFVAGCSEHDNDAVQGKILGKWLLVYEDGGWASRGSDFDAVYVTEFKPDSLVDYFRNDTLVGSDKYWIEKSNSLTYLYRFKSFQDIKIGILFIGTDTLMLAMECLDCDRWTYKRIE